jgi:hypothetical protein
MKKPNQTSMPRLNQGQITIGRWHIGQRIDPSVAPRKKGDGRSGLINTGTAQVMNSL